MCMRDGAREGVGNRVMSVYICVCRQARNGVSVSRLWTENMRLKQLFASY